MARKKTKPDKAYLTVAEFARWAGVTSTRVRQWIAAKRLPTLRPEPPYLIPISAEKPAAIAPGPKVSAT